MLTPEWYWKKTEKLEKNNVDWQRINEINTEISRILSEKFIEIKKINILLKERKKLFDIIINQNKLLKSVTDKTIKALGDNNVYQRLELTQNNAGEQVKKLQGCIAYIQRFRKHIDTQKDNIEMFSLFLNNNPEKCILFLNKIIRFDNLLMKQQEFADNFRNTMVKIINQYTDFLEKQKKTAERLVA